MSQKGINKVILIGHLGRDPELRFTQQQQAVATLTLATGSTWKDQNGQQQERTEWHRVVIFGKLAEITCQYLKKGSKAYIEGKLQTRKWLDQSGVERYTTEVVVGIDGTVHFLSGSGTNPSEPTPPPPEPQNNAVMDDLVPF